MYVYIHVCACVCARVCACKCVSDISVLKVCKIEKIFSSLRR